MFKNLLLSASTSLSSLLQRNDSASTAFLTENAEHLAQKKQEWDLRPALSAIMSVQNWILDRIPDQKLVILLPEEHDTHTHSLLQQAVLRALAAQRSEHPDRTVAFGYEAPHNHFFKGRMAYTAADDRETLRKLAGAVAFDETLIPMKSLFTTCQDLNVSVSLNDIAKKTAPKTSKRIVNIDQADLLSLDIVRRYAPQFLDTDIPRATEFEDDGVSHAEGIRLSNLCIVENAMRHMERTNARIYVQEAGSLHVFGMKKGLFGDEYKFEDSLSARFLERGFSVLPVIASHPAWKMDSPAKAATITKGSIKLDLPGKVTQDPTYADTRRIVNTASNLNLI